MEKSQEVNMANWGLLTHERRIYMLWLVYLKSKTKRKIKQTRRTRAIWCLKIVLISSFKDIPVFKIKDLFSKLESLNFGRKIIYLNRKIMSVNICSAPIHFPSFPQIASTLYKYLNCTECKWPHWKINVSAQDFIKQ